MKDFGFTRLQQDKKTRARTGVIHTPHGDIQTPAFVPVGTQATVKSLSPDDLDTIGVQLYFVNTYHMYLRPGIEVIKAAGGLHRFMGWDKPVITDSGGFQVFSLGRNNRSVKRVLAGVFPQENPQGDPFLGAPRRPSPAEVPQLVKISEEGVEFRSHWDGSKHVFTPEKSMELQWQLGSDLHIAFDDCTPYPVTPEAAKKSMERTHRWAARSLSASEQIKVKSQKLGMPYQALYGSIQGSVYKDLREQSAKCISAMDFDGIAIGGVSVGESKKEMVDVLSWVTPFLPEDKPRHLLGVGEFDDIFALVEHGMDTFDCVAPTRLARMGCVYTNSKFEIPASPAGGQNSKFVLDLNKAHHAMDTEPINRQCGCYTCAHFSRAYLHHLFHVRELLAYRLASIHNLHVVHQLVAQIRASIPDGSFLDLKKQWLYNKG